MTDMSTGAGKPPVGRVLAAAGVFDIALGAGLYVGNPLGLDEWLCIVLASALVLSGVSVIGLGRWLERRQAAARNSGRRRLIE